MVWNTGPLDWESSALTTTQKDRISKPNTFNSLEYSIYGFQCVKKANASLYFTAGLIKRVYSARVVDERGGYGVEPPTKFSNRWEFERIFTKQGLLGKKRGGVNFFQELQFLHENQTKI